MLKSSGKGKNTEVYLADFYNHAFNNAFNNATISNNPLPFFHFKGMTKSDRKAKIAIEKMMRRL